MVLVLSSENGGLRRTPEQHFHPSRTAVYTTAVASGTYRIDDGLVDLRTGVAARRGCFVRVPEPAARLLVTLAGAPDRTLSRADLARAVGAIEPGALEGWVWWLGTHLGGPQGPLIRRVSGDRLTLSGLGEAVPDRAHAILGAVTPGDLDPDGPGWEKLRAVARTRAEVLGLQVHTDGALAVVVHAEDAALIRSWTRGLLRPVESEGQVGVAIDAVDWAEGLGPAVLDAASREVRTLSMHAFGTELVSDRARRKVEPLQTLFPVGEIQGAGVRPVRVWSPSAEAVMLLERVPMGFRPRSVGGVLDRDEAEAALGALSGPAGLVVLHGVEGSGCTSLALGIADEVERRAERRAFAAWLEDDGSVRYALARAIGLVEADIEHVVRSVAGLGPALLVLDGLDRVDPTEARSTLTRLRKAAPRCAVLATSRRPLRLPGAIHVGVGPLSPEQAWALVRCWTGHRPGWGLPDARTRMTAVFEDIGTRPRDLRMVSGLGLPPSLTVARLRRAGPDASLIDLARATLPAPARAALDRLRCVGGRRLTGSDVRLVLGSRFPDPVGMALTLVDAGFLDIHLGGRGEHVAWRMPRALRDAVPRALSASAERRIRRSVVGARLERAVGLARSLHDEGVDAEVLAGIRRHDRALVRWFHERRGEPEEMVEGLDALALLWELGRVDSAGVQRVLRRLPDDACAHPMAGILGGLVACDLGQVDRARELALRAVGDGEGPLADVALAVALIATPRTEPSARRHLAGLARRALSDTHPVRLRFASHLIEALTTHGLYGDAVAVADHYAAFARTLRAPWRRAVAELHGWRARAAVDQVRREDITRLIGALRRLQRSGDHRRVAAGIQILARFLTAAGDPSSAMRILLRYGAYIDAFGVWSVRQMMHLDRARALALTGQLEQARVAVERHRELVRVPPGLPRFIGDLDLAMICLVDLDVIGARQALQGMAGQPLPAAYARVASVLGDVVAVVAGEEVEPMRGLPVGARPDEVALRKLVAAWVSDRSTSEVLRGAQAGQLARSFTLWGVAYRAICATIMRHAMFLEAGATPAPH